MLSALVCLASLLNQEPTKIISLPVSSVALKTVSPQKCRLCQDFASTAVLTDFPTLYKHVSEHNLGVY